MSHSCSCFSTSSRLLFIFHSTLFLGLEYFSRETDNIFAYLLENTSSFFLFGLNVLAENTGEGIPSINCLV
ncbi:MAG: hypothetical protein Q8S84_06890 [bacterium]|nr:hypothetical protein [bacterium]